VRVSRSLNSSQSSYTGSIPARSTNSNAVTSGARKKDSDVGNSDQTPENQALLRDFLLAALRTAALRCALDRNEIESIGAALRNNWITPEYAIEWLMDTGLIGQVEVQP